MPPPALLVHGIWDRSARFDRIRTALEGGQAEVEAVELEPNDGSAPIEELALQVERAVERLLARTSQDRLDLVGFSMGALVSRYWLQRMNGCHRTRRFVSISGPHGGTATAFLSRKAGVRQMRPGSALLADLARDKDPWGSAEVHVLWTPFDVMIVPARSSRLPGVQGEHRLTAVLLHRWMITHSAAVARVAEILQR